MAITHRFSSGHPLFRSSFHEGDRITEDEDRLKDNGDESYDVQTVVVEIIMVDNEKKTKQPEINGREHSYRLGVVVLKFLTVVSK